MPCLRVNQLSCPAGRSVEQADQKPVLVGLLFAHFCLTLEVDTRSQGFLSGGSASACFRNPSTAQSRYVAAARSAGHSARTRSAVVIAARCDPDSYSAFIRWSNRVRFGSTPGRSHCPTTNRTRFRSPAAYATAAIRRVSLRLGS